MQKYAEAESQVCTERAHSDQTKLNRNLPVTTYLNAKYGSVDLPPRKGIRICRSCRLVPTKSVGYQKSLFLRQERSSVEGAGKNDVGENSDGSSHQTLHNENPAPSVDGLLRSGQVSFAAKSVQTGCEKAAETVGLGKTSVTQPGEPVAISLTLRTNWHWNR